MPDPESASHPAHVNYHITHTTTYQYLDPVSVSHHLLRLTPRALARQRCLRHELQIDPSPAVATDRVDYFGNPVRHFTVQEPHRKLTVQSVCEIELAPAPWPAAADTPAWETVRDLFRDGPQPLALEACEFAFDSPLIKVSAELAAYAAPSFPAHRPLLETVLDLTQRIHRDFAFDPQATTVSTPLDQVLGSRRGVCQDFAHLEIGCLRTMGLAARYVSGYLQTVPPPGQPRLAGADASHAWVAVACPPVGWIDADPTNNLLPSTTHVTLAWGRDYSDVSPIRGVIVGGGAHSLKVSVDVAAAGQYG